MTARGASRIGRLRRRRWAVPADGVPLARQRRPRTALRATARRRVLDAQQRAEELNELVLGERRPDLTGAFGGLMEPRRAGLPREQRDALLRAETRAWRAAARVERDNGRVWEAKARSAAGRGRGEEPFIGPTMGWARPRPMLSEELPAPSRLYRRGRGAVRVMSFNVLSPYLMRGVHGSRTRVDEAMLSWPYRLALLRRRIEQMRPSVVCLQEVCPATAPEDLAVEGYTVVMQQAKGRKEKRPPPAAAAAAAGGDPLGHEVLRLAVLYRTDEFELCTAQSRTRAMAVRLRPRGAAAGTAEVLHVANVHFKAGNEEGSAKLRTYQARSIARRLRGMLLHHEAAEASAGADGDGAAAGEAEARAAPLRYEDLAVVVCGDFNSRPDTPLYRYMLTGEAERSRSLPVADLRHHLDLRSAYRDVTGNEPRLTAGVPFRHALPRDRRGTPDHVRKTPDYIFYSPQALQPAMAVLPYRSDVEASALIKRGLPNEFNGSDHLPLCVDLEFVRPAAAAAAAAAAAEELELRREAERVRRLEECAAPEPPAEQKPFSWYGDNPPPKPREKSPGF